MDYSLLFLGIAPMFIFIPLLVIEWKIIKTMKKEPDVALSKLFLRDEALLGFKVLAGSNFLLAIPLAAEAIGVITGNTGLAARARYAMPFAMIGALYFYIKIYQATKPYED